MILGLAMFASAALILSLTSKLTFIADEWDLMLLRPGWGIGQIMDPFNEHPVVLPSISFKLLQELFGMDSARPQQLLATATFLVMNGVLFVYLRRRVGEWAALIGTVLILFLGAAFEDLLWAFQIGYFGSLAAGIAALIALGRDDRTGDIAASVLLVVSLAFSSLGIPFVAAAAVEWAINPRERRRRLFVPGAAFVFYVLWWIGWGHTAESSIDPGRITEIPGFVFDSFAAGFTSLAGLATGDGSEPDQPNLIWGRLIALIAIGLAAWRIKRLGRVPTGLLITGAAAFAFWVLSGINRNEMRLPTSSRYQLPSAIFMLLMAASLLDGIRIRRPGLIVAGVLSVVAISGGIGLMTSQSEDRWQPASGHTRATLAGVEAAGGDVTEGYRFTVGTSFEIPARAYLDAVEAHGSPAWPGDAIDGLEPPYRATLDASLIDAAGVAVSGTPPPLPSKSCRPFESGVPYAVRPGALRIVNPSGSELAVSASRYSDPPGTPVGAVLPRAVAGLYLPEAGGGPWQLTLFGESPVLCSRR